MYQTIPSEVNLLLEATTQPPKDPCSSHISEIEGFLYGLPAGLLLSVLLLVCFVMFGNAVTGYTSNRRTQASASSITRIDKQSLLGKKHKRGPQPSVDLRPVDMNQMALSEDAPDDIKAMALAGKLSKVKTPAKSAAGS